MKKPPASEWKMYDAYMVAGRSASKAVAALGGDITKARLVRGVMRCSDWKRLSGWSDAYAEALRLGFSQSDAEMHADQRADYNTRGGVKP